MLVHLRAGQDNTIKWTLYFFLTPCC